MSKRRLKDRRTLGRRTGGGAELRDLLFVCFAKQKVDGSRQQTLTKPGRSGVRVVVPLPSRTGREGREATARDASEMTSETFSFGKWSPSSTVTGRTNLYLQEDKTRGKRKPWSKT